MNRLSIQNIVLLLIFLFGSQVFAQPRLGLGETENQSQHTDSTDENLAKTNLNGLLISFQHMKIDISSIPLKFREVTGPKLKDEIDEDEYSTSIFVSIGYMRKINIIGATQLGFALHGLFTQQVRTSPGGQAGVGPYGPVIIAGWPFGGLEIEGVIPIHFIPEISLETPLLFNGLGIGVSLTYYKLNLYSGFGDEVQHHITLSEIYPLSIYATYILWRTKLGYVGARAGIRKPYIRNMASGNEVESAISRGVFFELRAFF